MLRTSSRQVAETYQTIEGIVALREARLRYIASKELLINKARPSREYQAVWDAQKRILGMTMDVMNDRAVTNPFSEGYQPVPFQAVAGAATESKYDPSFPAKFFSGSTTAPSAMLFFQWDAYDEASTAIEIHADRLLATAAVFVIALYLFAQSCSLPRAHPRGVLIARTGFILLIVATTLTILGPQTYPDIEGPALLPGACSASGLRSPTTRANVAPTCFAYAESLNAMARDRIDFDRARDAYSAAATEDIGAGFPLAYYRMNGATASQLAYTQGTLPGTINPDHLSEIIANEQRAIESFQDRARVSPAALLGSLGYHEYLRQTETRDGDWSLDDAIGHLKAAAPDDRAARAAPSLNAASRFRLAIALLAAGRTEESLTEYGDALGELPNNDLVIDKDLVTEDDVRIADEIRASQSTNSSAWVESVEGQTRRARPDR